LYAIMNNLNLLYKDIFNNRYVRDRVYHYIYHYGWCKESKRYCDIYSLKWMIKWQHFTLLKDKLLREPHLIYYKSVYHTIGLLVKLKDIELIELLYHQLYNQFNVDDDKDTLDILNKAVIENNSIVYKYLLSKGHSLLYIKEAVDIAVNNNNLILLKLIINSSSITTTVENGIDWQKSLKQSLKNKNVYLVEYCLEFFEQDSIREDTGQKELFKCCLMSNVKCIKLIQSKLPSVCNSISQQFFIGSIKLITEFQVLDYLIRAYNFNINAADKIVVTKWIVSFVVDKKWECIDYLMNILDKETINRNELVVKAFRDLKFKDSQPVYLLKYVEKETFPYSIFYLWEISGSLKDLASATQYHKAGCCIGAYSIFESAHTTDVFLYLWNQLIVEDQYSINNKFVDQLVVSCCTYNNLDILKFLESVDCLSMTGVFKQQSEWLNDLICHNPIDCIPTLKYLFESKTIPVNLKFTLKYDDPKLHNLILFFLKENRLEESSFPKLFKKAIQYQSLDIMKQLGKLGYICKSISGDAEIDLIEYLLEVGASVDKITISEAANRGNLELLEFIYKNIKPCPKVPLSTIIECIKNSKLSSLEFILENYEIVIDQPIETMMVQLGSTNHLGIVDYIYNNQHLFVSSGGIPKLPFMITFNQTIQFSNLLLFKYFYETVGFKLNKTATKKIQVDSGSEIYHYIKDKEPCLFETDDLF